MHWVDGAIFSLLYDGEKLLGRTLKANCCNWICYDGTQGDLGYGTQVPGMWPTLPDAKRGLEGYLKLKEGK